MKIHSRCQHSTVSHHKKLDCNSCKGKKKDNLAVLPPHVIQSTPVSLPRLLVTFLSHCSLIIGYKLSVSRDSFLDSLLLLFLSRQIIVVDYWISG